MKRRIVPNSFFLAIFMVLLLTSMHYDPAIANPTFSEERTDLSGIKVAVYNGTSVSSCIASRIGLVNMYEWMSATVDVLNATDIQIGALENYEILAMPGGNPLTFNYEIGVNGTDNIRNWVSRGGSYFGICGGAMYASKAICFSGTTSYYQLSLFNGTVTGPIEGLYGLTKLDMNTGCAGPNLSDIPKTLNSLYLGGGYYVPDEGQSVFTLATYDENSERAIIASTFGHGSYCLSAVHTEIEENSDRDGTDKWDSHDDQDSEWGLMLEVSIWQIESTTWVTPSETTTTTTTTDSTDTTSPPWNDLMGANLPIIALSGVLIVAVLFVVILKRR
ncbi:MAG: BPL-N domain-containing protein [Candidatus Hodarchaeota archaeon]